MTITLDQKLTERLHDLAERGHIPDVNAFALRLLDDALRYEEDGMNAWNNMSESEKAHWDEIIRRGMEDVEAGRVKSLEEFDREFRKRHNLPPANPK